jgi:16S rRNA (adenine1518-N6/adenine1519-N6)-dimethyltransferase
MPSNSDSLTRPSTVRALLAELDCHPSRVLGQNFLVDRNIRDLILKAAAVRDDETVLEIGPGLGVLTGALLAAAAHVVAVEKDARLCRHLRETLVAQGLELVEGDVMDLGIPDWLGARAPRIDVVVSNLPYGVGSRVLADLVMTPAGPERIVVTVQKEVADRVAATPGTRDSGLLSVWCQLAYRVECIHTVSATCFWPPPEVRSETIRLERREDVELEEHEREAFRALTRFAFTQRRKQLATILARAPGDLRRPAAEVSAWLEAYGLSPRARPEALSAAAWLAFVRDMKRH